MNKEKIGDIDLKHIRLLFNRVGIYKDAANKEISTNGFLHKWYFDLYDTMYANGIKIGINYFLSIFLKFVKNENTILHEQINNLSKNEYYESYNFFIETQVNLRFLDYFLNNDFNEENMKEELELLKTDLDRNNKNSISIEKEERDIHTEVIDLLTQLFKESKTTTSREFPFRYYLKIFYFEDLLHYFKSFPIDEDRLKICASKDDINIVKQTVKNSIIRFQDVFMEDFTNTSSFSMSFKDQSFTTKLFEEALKYAFTVELYYKCYANEKSRSKLKTRANSDKEKYKDIKDFAKTYYELTKGKKSTLSYIPPMVFGLEIGLNIDSIFVLCNKYYSYNSNSELNRKEFDKNIDLFLKTMTNRQNLDQYINEFKKETFVEPKYNLISNDSATINNDIYIQFYYFIVYYMISNGMDIDNNNLFTEQTTINIDNTSIEDLMTFFGKRDLNIIETDSEFSDTVELNLTQEQIKLIDEKLSKD